MLTVVDGDWGSGLSDIPVGKEAVTTTGGNMGARLVIGRPIDLNKDGYKV